ncbi:MAG: gliding motility protein GldM [Chitinophagaceae bacterium]|nr:MAG: gliding motility protein GldM [Chitinophagaceae bacterium]
MSLPREPRQKMINMMYLVLTAMLALNVSSEILNAFKTVNNSLEISGATVNISTETIMTSLLEKTKKPETAERANIWQPKADQVHKISAEVYGYVEGIKKEIMLQTQYDPKDEKEKGIDNLDVTTRLMVEKGEGMVLYNKLKDFHKRVLAVDTLIARTFENALPIDLEMPKTKSKSNNTWDKAYFHMVPTIAALTILSKFQSDIRTSENKIVTFCHEQVGKVDVRYDTYAAVVGQNATYLLPGQELEISAGVGAFSKAAKPVISIGGTTVALGEDGAAHWKSRVNEVGHKSVTVKVNFVDQNGKQQSIDKVIEYTVGQSNAAAQLDKLNVLFIGVDNPVTVSGSGSVDQLEVSITGGGGVLTGSKGKYLARVTQETDNCLINIKTPDGKITPIKFRVRSIPDPTPMIGTNKSGEISAALFKSQAGIRAIVENFFYETQFNVITFRMTADGSGFDDGIEEANNTGAAWNEARKIISKCRPGSFITVEDIYAMGPDGRRRKLTPLIYNLK